MFDIHNRESVQAQLGLKKMWYSNFYIKKYRHFFDIKNQRQQLSY